MRKRLDEIIAKHTGPAAREGQLRHRARLLHEQPRGGAEYGIIDRVIESH